MSDEIIGAVIGVVGAFILAILSAVYRRYCRGEPRQTSNGTSTTGDMEAQNQTPPPQNTNSPPDGQSQNAGTNNNTPNIKVENMNIHLTNISNSDNFTNVNNLTNKDYSGEDPSKMMGAEDFKKIKEEFEAKGNTVQNRAMLEGRSQKEPTEELKLWIENYEEIKRKCVDHLKKNMEEYEGSSQNIAFKMRSMADEMKAHIKKYNHFQLPLFVDELPPTVLEQPMDYVPVSSIEKNKNMVYEALNQCTVIGLWGMGGIGKTTLMKQINNEMTNGSDFNFVIWITVSSRERNIKNIQAEIFGRLKLDANSCTDNTADNAKRISDILKRNSRALIIFDDVWEPELDLKAIGIPKSKGCTVVITTRDQGVCRKMNAEEIKMSALNATESWELFKTNAGINEHVDPEIKEVANKVCKECAGLPLSITVVAKALNRETMGSLWRQTLKYLEDGDPHQGEPNLEENVYRPLKLSYDLLPNDDLKKGFLLCSLFPEDHIIQIDELICYGISGIGEGRIALGCQGLASLDAYRNIFILLKRKGLLQDVTEKEEEKDHQIHSARMHDVVRDVAIYIAKQAFNGYFDTKHISLLKNSGELPENVKEVKILSSNDNYMLNAINSPDFLKDMENELLLNLILEHKDVRNKSNVGIESIPIVDICIQKLKNLRALLIKNKSWFWFGLNYFIPVNMKDLLLLRGLSVLCLQGAYISELTEEFSERLVNLRVIDFSGTRIGIIRPKAFSRLENVLEVLNMEDSFSKWQAYSNEDGTDNMAFAELANLKKLYSLHVDIDDKRIFSHEYSPNLVFPLAPGFSIKSTKNTMFFKTFWYSNILLLSAIQLNSVAYWLQALLEKTEILKIDTMDHQGARQGGHVFRAVLEDDIVKVMCNLKKLEIKCIGIYKHVIRHSSTSIPILPKLEGMHLWRTEMGNMFESSTVIPNGSFERLKKIEIHMCHQLKYLFPMNVVVCLVQLEVLVIMWCSKLEVMIEKDDRDLDQGVCGLKAQVLFPKLRKMALAYLPNLTSLWQLQQSQEWSSLTELEVYRCEKLNRLFLVEKNAPMLQSIKCEKEWFDLLHWEEDQEASQIKSIVKFDIS